MTAEGEDPDHGIGQTLGIELEDVLVAVACAGQEGDVDAKTHEQEEQDGHHDLVGLFNAAGDAHRHDGERSDDRDNDPRQVADRNDVEMTADGRHILAHGMHVAGDGDRGVLEDPAHDDGIADGQRHGAEDRNEADGFADLFVAAQLGALTERADGACAGGTAERELADDAGGADENDADEIRDEERHAAPDGDHDGETPDVAHADGGTDAGQNKAPFGFKAVALCGCLLISHYFSLQ